MLSQDLDPETLFSRFRGVQLHTNLRNYSKEDDAADNAESNHHAYNEINENHLFPTFHHGNSQQIYRRFSFSYAS